jgi:hypothetical protein
MMHYSINSIERQSWMVKYGILKHLDIQIDIQTLDLDAEIST